MSSQHILELPILRASSAPLAVKCPGSTLPRNGQILVDTYKDDGTGTVGQNVHRAIALAVQDFIEHTDQSVVDGPDLSKDEDVLVNRAMAWLNEMGFLEAGNGKIYTEYNIQVPPFSGTQDFLRVLELSADVADFKNTWREDDYEPQLQTYAYLVFHAFPKVQTVRVYLPFLRKGKVADKIYDRKWIMSWAEEMKRNVIGVPIFRAGEHCTRCKRRNGCSALVQTVRHTVNELATLTSEDPKLGNVSLAKMAELWPRVKLVRESVELYRDAMERIVNEAGFVPLGDGKELRKVGYQQDHINVLKAWPVLQEKFTSDEDMAGFIEVKKGKMIDLVRARAPRGQKDKQERDFLEQLTQSGAVSKVERSQLREVKSQAGVTQ